MKQTLIIIVIVVFMAAGFGCSGSSANSAEANNANIAETIIADATPEAQFNIENITDANVALAEGNRLLDENQTESAIEALKQAVKINPDLAEAHFKLGIAYALQEMQMEQNGVITEPEPTPRAKKNGKDSMVKTNSEKAFEKAVEAYKKWLKANPKDDAAHFSLGRTYNKLNLDEEAEKEFKEAVKLNPNDTEYQTEHGAILIKLAKYREAISPLKKAVELDSSNTRAAELLDDAEAGRQRIDYQTPKKDANQAETNQSQNSKSKVNTSSNSNSTTKPAEENANKPQKPEIKESKPEVKVNKTEIKGKKG